MIKIAVDLHNHSCLSPCADLSMSPSHIAETAARRGLDLVALTDHNSTKNCPAFAVAALRFGVLPLFGVEMNSTEEVHILAIFGTLPEALSFGRFLWDNLPALTWDPEKLGMQVVVDADDIVLEEPSKYFGASLDLSFDELASAASRRGALVVPAHVDRARYSVGSQLGFLPEGPFDAVEAVAPPVSGALRGDHAVITGSDAHFDLHIGRRPFYLEIPEEPFLRYKAALSRRHEELISSSGVEVEKLWPDGEAKAFLESVRDSIRSGRIEARDFSRPNGSKSG